MIEQLELHPLEICVFIKALQPPFDEGRLSKFLSADELHRANRFLTPELKARFITSRGTLREILSKIIETDPAQVPLSYLVKGKPILSYPFETQIHFNVSHSGEYLVIGLSKTQELGVDVEYRNPNIDLWKLSDQVLAESEIEGLKRARKEARLPLFFDLWTAKEAFLKATGTGLGLDPKAVSWDPEKNTVSLVSEVELGLQSPWYLHRFSIDPLYSSALVSQQEKCQLRLQFLSSP